MPLIIELIDNDIQYLNEQAKGELRNRLLSYSYEVLREASRLEATIKTTRGNPEITSSMINDAAILISRGYIKPHKPIWLTIVKIFAVLISAITGFVMEKITEPWGPYVFAVSFVIAAILTIISIMKE